MQCTGAPGRSGLHCCMVLFLCLGGGGLLGDGRQDLWGHSTDVDAKVGKERDNNSSEENKGGMTGRKDLKRTEERLWKIEGSFHQHLKTVIMDNLEDCNS